MTMQEDYKQLRKRMKECCRLTASFGVFDTVIHGMLTLQVGPKDFHVLGTLEIPREDYPVLLALLQAGADQIPEMEFDYKIVYRNEEHSSGENNEDLGTVA